MAAGRSWERRVPGRLFSSVILAAAFAAPAAAQDPAFVKTLADIERAVPAPSPAEMAPRALETLQAVARTEQRCVPTGVVMEPAASASATQQVATWIGAKQISNGWTAYGRLQGCPARAPTRFVVLRLPSGELYVRIVNVGESLTAPWALAETSPIVSVAAMGAIQKAYPECTGVEGLKLEETRVAARSSDLGPDFRGQRYKGSWEEVWTYSQCSHRAEVTVAFVTDGQGGHRWSADERKVKALD
jgi:hypothetical protein